MKLLKVVRSNNKSKKYTAVFLVDGRERRISFGATNYRDYTLLNDKTSKFYLPNKSDRDVVKDSYKRRHRKDLETNDPMRPGYLSYYLLWNKKTLASAIKYYKKRFKL